MKGRSNSAILPRIATLAGGAFLGSLVYSTTALALPPLITEVQPYPSDTPPTHLVVYGENFGLISDGGTVDPEFTFGTGRIGAYNGYLAISADQSMCPVPVDDPFAALPGNTNHRRPLPHGRIRPSAVSHCIPCRRPKNFGSPICCELPNPPDTGFRYRFLFRNVTEARP